MRHNSKEHNKEKVFGKCLLCAGKTQERLHLSLSKGRKLLTDHPKKAFFTFIFSPGISCDRIAQIIKASVRGG